MPNMAFKKISCCLSLIVALSGMHMPEVHSIWWEQHFNGNNLSIPGVTLTSMKAFCVVKHELVSIINDSSRSLEWISHLYAVSKVVVFLYYLMFTHFVVLSSKVTSKPMIFVILVYFSTGKLGKLFTAQSLNKFEAKSVPDFTIPKGSSWIVCIALGSNPIKCRLPNKSALPSHDIRSIVPFPELLVSAVVLMKSWYLLSCIELFWEYWSTRTEEALWGGPQNCHALVGRFRGNTTLLSQR